MMKVEDLESASSVKGTAGAPPGKVIPIQPTSEEVALYEIRKKIHPRAVHGWFAGWRWTLVFATQAIGMTTAATNLLLLGLTVAAVAGFWRLPRPLRA